MDMDQLMQQAQMMQQQLLQAQEEMKQMKCTATAGGGMVEVTATGEGTIESIVIKPEVVDPDDVEMLQDMVLVAVNEARMASMTGGLSIPGLF